MGYFRQAHGPAAIPTMHLGWGLTALCVAVVAIVLIMVLAALFRRRPRAGHHVLGREGGGMAFVYISVGVSTLALFVALFYTLITLEAVAHPPGPPALTIKVTARDWWWEVAYEDPANPDRKFVTANEIHIPTGVPVRIDLESVDVLHSFWVPQLAGKTQAIPGQVNSLWIQADKPGVYRGQCAAFCGAQHANMAFEVHARAPDRFDAWRTEQLRPARAPADARTRAGQKIFMKHCAACHAVRGTAAQGAFGPDLTHLMSRRRIGAGMLDNSPQQIMRWVRHVQAIKPDSLMPGFALEPQDTAALRAYLATLD